MNEEMKENIEVEEEEEDWEATQALVGVQEAITMKDSIAVINADECTECGECVETCPAEGVEG